MSLHTTSFEFLASLETEGPMGRTHLAAECAWARRGSNMDVLGLERARSPLALPDLRPVPPSAKPSHHPGPAENSKGCKPLCHLHVPPARLEIWSSTSFTVIQQQAALDGYAYKRAPFLLQNMACSLRPQAEIKQVPLLPAHQ